MWFAVSIFLKGESTGKPPAEWLWQENIALFDCDSAHAAAELGAQYGRKHEATFTSVTGDDIHWSFDCVCSVYAIDDAPVSGIEVFSRFLRASEAASLLTPFD